MQNEIREIHKKIQDMLMKLVPEKWDSIFLYASVMPGKNGEMYFYYFPKKLIRTKPVNCYEIPHKFGIDEFAYNGALSQLYSYIKELDDYSFPKWTNMTLIIKNNNFTIEHRYNNLNQSKYNDEQRRVLWSYKYLHTPIESFSIADRNMIKNYREDMSERPAIFTDFFNMNTAGANKKDYETGNNEENGATYKQ